MNQNTKELINRSQTDYFTVAELAELWRCSSDMVYSLLKSGKLRGFKLGKDWRITDEARVEYETCGGVPDVPTRIPRGKKQIITRVV